MYQLDPKQVRFPRAYITDHDLGRQVGEIPQGHAATYSDSSGRYSTLQTRVFLFLPYLESVLDSGDKSKNGVVSISLL